MKGSGVMEDIHVNYDPVFKEALILFKDKALDFLGLTGIAPITEPLRTESVEIEIKIEVRDLNFGTQDGRGLHFEEEVNLSHDDLLRFCGYNTGLSRTYKREFITVVFVKNPTTLTEVRTKQLNFMPVIVQCSKIDADAMLNKLREDIAAGRPINELELVYLPLFHSIKLNPTELFKESTGLINNLQIDDDRKRKIYALSILLANKVVEKTQLDIALEEVLNMGNIILETVKNYGEQRGRLSEKEELAIKMINKGYDSLEIIELTDLSIEHIRKLRESARTVVEDV